MAGLFAGYTGRAGAAAQRGNPRQMIAEAQRALIEARRRIAELRPDYDAARSALAQATIQRDLAHGTSGEAAAIGALEQAEDVMHAQQERMDVAQRAEQAALLLIRQNRQDRRSQRSVITRGLGGIAKFALHRYGYGHPDDHRRAYDMSPHSSRLMRAAGSLAEHFGHGQVFHAFASDADLAQQRIDQTRGRAGSSGVGGKPDPIVQRGVRAAAKRAAGREKNEERRERETAREAVREGRHQETQRRREERHAVMVAHRAERNAEREQARVKRQQQAEADRLARAAATKARREEDAAERQRARDAAAAARQKERDEAATRRAGMHPSQRVSAPETPGAPDPLQSVTATDAQTQPPPTATTPSAPSAEPAPAVATSSPAARAQAPLPRSMAHGGFGGAGVLRAIEALTAAIQDGAVAESKRHQELLQTLEWGLARPAAAPVSDSPAVGATTAIAPGPTRGSNGRFVSTKANAAESEPPNPTPVSLPTEPVRPANPTAARSKVAWTEARGGDSFKTVWVDVKKLDKAWGQDKRSYVGRGGQGGTKTRYPDFGQWMQGGKAVKMPELTFNEQRGLPSFSNGRHRFAWMRDQGAKAIPFHVPDYAAAEIERQFGTKMRSTSVAKPEQADAVTAFKEAAPAAVARPEPTKSGAGAGDPWGRGWRTSVEIQRAEKVGYAEALRRSREERAAADARSAGVGETEPAPTPAVNPKAKAARKRAQPYRQSGDVLRGPVLSAEDTLPPEAPSITESVQRAARADRAGDRANPIQAAESIVAPAEQAARDRSTPIQLASAGKPAALEAAQANSSPGAAEEKPTTLSAGPSRYVPLVADNGGGEMSQGAGGVAVAVQGMHAVLSELRALHMDWRRAADAEAAWRERQDAIEAKRHEESLAALAEKQAEANTPHAAGTDGKGADGKGKGGGGSGLVDGLIKRAEVGLAVAAGGAGLKVMRRVRSAFSRGGKAAAIPTAEVAAAGEEGAGTGSRLLRAGRGAAGSVLKMAGRVAKLGAGKGGVGALLTLAGIVGYESVAKLVRTMGAGAQNKAAPGMPEGEAPTASTAARAATPEAAVQAPASAAASESVPEAAASAARKAPPAPPASTAAPQPEASAPKAPAPEPAKIPASRTPGPATGGQSILGPHPEELLQAPAAAPRALASGERVVGHARSGAPIREVDRRAGKGLGRWMGKAFGPAAAGMISGYACYSELEDLFGRYANRKISQEQYRTEFVDIVTRSVGGLAGAEVGGWLGGVVGSALGPAGTVVGAIGGGMIGQEIGSALGGAVGQTDAAKAALDPLANWAAPPQEGATGKLDFQDFDKGASPAAPGAASPAPEPAPQPSRPVADAGSPSRGVQVAELQTPGVVSDAAPAVSAELLASRAAQSHTTPIKLAQADKSEPNPGLASVRSAIEVAKTDHERAHGPGSWDKLSPEAREAATHAKVERATPQKPANGTAPAPDAIDKALDAAKAEYERSNGRGSWAGASQSVRTAAAQLHLQRIQAEPGTYAAAVAQHAQDAHPETAIKPRQPGESESEAAVRQQYERRNQDEARKWKGVGGAQTPWDKIPAQARQQMIAGHENQQALLREGAGKKAARAATGQEIDDYGRRIHPDSPGVGQTTPVAPGDPRQAPELAAPVQQPYPNPQSAPADVQSDAAAMMEGMQRNRAAQGDANPAPSYPGTSGLRQPGTPAVVGPATGGPATPITGSTFADKAPQVMQRLQSDFQLTREQAAGVVGNLGHESGGFRHLQEIRPVNGGQGGLGWAQWTGPRRKSFEAWSRQNGLDPHSDEANYGFLKHELQTTQRGSIQAVRGARTTAEATRAFEAKFERADPRYKHYESRDRYAQQALAAAARQPQQVASSPAAPAAEVGATPPRGSAAQAANTTPSVGAVTGGAATGGGVTADSLRQRYAGLRTAVRAPGGQAQCVDLARDAAGIGHTGEWRAGDAAHGSLPPGTPIATFDANGRYGNHTDGSSHTAVVLGPAAGGGVRILEQWKGHAPRERVLTNTGRGGMNDLSSYRTVEGTRGSATERARAQQVAAAAQPAAGAQANAQPGAQPAAGAQASAQPGAQPAATQVADAQAAGPTGAQPAAAQVADATNAGDAPAVQTAFQGPVQPSAAEAEAVPEIANTQRSRDSAAHDSANGGDTPADLGMPTMPQVVGGGGGAGGGGGGGQPAGKSGGGLSNPPARVDEISPLILALNAGFFN